MSSNSRAAKKKQGGSNPTEADESNNQKLEAGSFKSLEEANIQLVTMQIRVLQLDEQRKLLELEELKKNAEFKKKEHQLAINNLTLNNKKKEQEVNALSLNNQEAHTRNQMLELDYEQKKRNIIEELTKYY